MAENIYSEESEYISADDVNIDLERTIQELADKLTRKIGKLSGKRENRDLMETSEREALEKKHDDNLKTISLKKEKQIAKILKEEKREIEAENSAFVLEKENREMNHNSMKNAINYSIDVLIKKLVQITDKLDENEALKKGMECPVCLDQMKPPTRIFQCTSGHLLCEECKCKMRGGKCPTCKKAQIMGRAIAMEQMARTLYLKEN